MPGCYSRLMSARSINGCFELRGFRPMPTGVFVRSRRGASVFRSSLRRRMERRTSKLKRIVTWPKGAVEQTVDLTLTRGAVIRGTVVEEGSGRAVAGACVTFWHLLGMTSIGGPGSVILSLRPTGRSSSQCSRVPVISRFRPRMTITFSVKWASTRYRRAHLAAGAIYSNCFVACEPKLNGPCARVSHRTSTGCDGFRPPGRAG